MVAWNNWDPMATSAPIQRRSIQSWHTADLLGSADRLDVKPRLNVLVSTEAGVRRIPPTALERQSAAVEAILVDAPEPVRLLGHDHVIIGGDLTMLPAEAIARVVAARPDAIIHLRQDRVPRDAEYLPLVTLWRDVEQAHPGRTHLSLPTGMALYTGRIAEEPKWTGRVLDLRRVVRTTPMAHAVALLGAYEAAGLLDAAATRAYFEEDSARHWDAAWRRTFLKPRYREMKAHIVKACAAIVRQEPETQWRPHYDRAQAELAAQAQLWDHLPLSRWGWMVLDVTHDRSERWALASAGRWLSAINQGKAARELWKDYLGETHPGSVPGMLARACHAISALQPKRHIDCQIRDNRLDPLQFAQWALAPKAAGEVVAALTTYAAVSVTVAAAVDRTPWIEFFFACNDAHLTLLMRADPAGDEATLRSMAARRRWSFRRGEYSRWELVIPLTQFERQPRIDAALLDDAR